MTAQLVVERRGWLRRRHVVLVGSAVVESFKTEREAQACALGFQLGFSYCVKLACAMEGLPKKRASEMLGENAS